MPVVQKAVSSVAKSQPPKPQEAKKETVAVIPVAKAEEPKKASAPVDGCIGKTFEHLTPEYLEKIQKTFPTYFAPYKVQRINEMACLWKGKKFEPYTVSLIAMLLQENGAMDAEVRGDSGYAFGLSQEHICGRGLVGDYLGTDLFEHRTFCTWKYGLSPAQRVEKAFPEFSKEWTSQFFYFSQYISPMIDDGMTAEQIIHAWNRREVGRQAKVNKHKPFVKMVLNIQ